MDLDNTKTGNSERETKNTNSGEVRSFVNRAEDNIRGGQNQPAVNNFGRDPVRRNNSNQNQQGHNRHNPGRNRHQRSRNGQAPEQARHQERQERNDRYDRTAHAIRDTVDGIQRRPQRGAKEETIEDIRRDIITIEKEIALEISDISVLKLNV